MRRSYALVEGQTLHVAPARPHPRSLTISDVGSPRTGRAGYASLVPGDLRPGRTAVVTGIAVAAPLERYGPAIAAARASAVRSAAAGMPADDVAAVVARALAARRPRARYLVGTDARIGAMVAQLPDRLRDRLVLGRTVR